MGKLKQKASSDGMRLKAHDVVSMEMQRHIQLAMDRKGMNGVDIDSACGFVKNYTNTRILNPKRGNPATAEFWRIVQIAQVLECPELVQIAELPWRIIQPTNSGFKAFGDPVRTAKRWLTFTRCLSSYMLCREMISWYNGKTLGLMGWSPEQIERFRTARTPRNDEVRKQHVDGIFEHYVIMREAVFHDAAAEQCDWVRWTIDLLKDELRATTRLVIVSPADWARVNAEFYAATGINRPCTVDVVDDRFAMVIKSCGEEKRATNSLVEIRRLTEAIERLLPSLRVDPKDTINHLKNLVLGKKSARF